MTTYVDVDTSAEAIQEDEELIEAVHQVLKNTTEIIYEDVKNDVSDIYMQALHVVETLFPFLVYWREDRSLFWDDMYNLMIFGSLFFVAFFILAPSRLWVRKSSSRSNLGPRSNSAERFRYLTSFSPFRKGSSRDSSSERFPPERRKSFSNDLYYNEIHRVPLQQDDDDDVETEVERFIKRWPTIVRTNYRCLVLPPGCKRVEKPRNAVDVEEDKNKQNDDFSDDDNNPYNRLVSYTKQILHLAMTFLKFDYVGAGRTLIHWLDSCLNAKNNREKREEEDDMDDDESDADSMLEKTPDKKEKSTTNIRFRSKRDSLMKWQTITTRQQHQEHQEQEQEHQEQQQQLSMETSTVKEKKGDQEKTKDTVPVVDDKQIYSFYSSDQFDEGNAEETIEFSKGDGDDDKQDATEETSNDTIDHVYSSLSSNPSLLTENEEKKEGVDDENTVTTLSTQEISSSTPPSSPRLQRRDSLNSVYETPQKENELVLESGERLAARLAMNGRSSGKSKDALENYRTSTTRKPRLEMKRINRVSTLLSGGFIPEPESNQVEESAGEGNFYFETVSTNESLRKMAVEVPVPDRNGYILGDDFLLDSESCPLLVFVNSRSGPQQGRLLITQLKGLLNPIQVWDLADGGPEEILKSFSVFTRLRILVCGGDGTVSWIVSTIEKLGLPHPWPPIAILPLGTGNDLARVHGWGGGYSNEPLIEILDQIAESYTSWLDRWELTVENKKGKVKGVKSFFNYFGVGADAQMALQVHQLREFKPQLFFSRVVNKAWYLIFGTEDIIKATSVNLPNQISLIADGVEIPLPADSQGIILMNIDSYGGGLPLWSRGTPVISRSNSNIGKTYSLTRSKSLDANILRGKLSTPDSTGNASFDEHDKPYMSLSDEETFNRITACDKPSSCQDGLLDVVSIRGSFHLGQVRLGLSTCQQLCQCRELSIVTKGKVTVQLDGEPWRQNAGTLHIRRKKDAAIMLHRSANDSNGVETEMAKLLDWAEERKHIDNRTHAVLMKEFSRRIESKTRERRERSKDNLFSLMRANASSVELGKGGNSSGIMF